MPKNEIVDRGPMLFDLIKSGTIFFQDGQYIGIAADRTEVLIGYEGREKEIEEYLTDYPEPKNW